MASTIQLKTGTGSAVPSSLTQGEVAINIDNGLVYYGSGSTNTTKQLESFTHITASGDISASGTIIGNKIETDTLFSRAGDANTGLQFSSDTVKIEGNDGIVAVFNQSKIEFNSPITASGTISGSTLIANTGGGFKLQGNAQQGPTIIKDSIISGSNLKLHGSASIDGHVSASSFAAVEGTGSFGKIVGTLLTAAQPNVTTLVGTTAIGTSGAATTFAGTVNINEAVTVDTTLGVTGLTTLTGGIVDGAIVSGSNLKLHGSASIDGHVTASGNISASGTIITEDLQVDTIVNQSTGGGIILDAAGFIGLDSAGGDIRFRKSGTNQLHFDMDGTAGAQVISPSVAGDDIIFKNQGGDSVLTLKSEGQTEIHGNITASGDISSSGNIYSDNIEILAQGSARVSSISNTTDYWGPNFQGPYHTANWNRNTTPESNGNIILTRQHTNTGFIVPYSCSLVGFDSIGGLNSGEDTPFSMSLFTADALGGMDLNSTNNVADNFTASLVCTGISQGSTGFNRHRMTGSCEVPLSPFSVVFPLAKVDASGNDDGAMSLDITYVLKIKRIK